jgi:hypothetical protein
MWSVVGSLFLTNLLMDRSGSITQSKRRADPRTPASAERSEVERSEAEWRSEDRFAITFDNNQIWLSKEAQILALESREDSLNVFRPPEVDVSEN